jgi:hypothetical protein
VYLFVYVLVCVKIVVHYEHVSFLRDTCKDRTWRKENRREQGKELIVVWDVLNDNQAFHGLIIKPFDNQTVSLP